MQTRWLICNLGKPEKIQEMAYAVQETGRKAEIVSLKELNDIVEATNNETECVITMGSIWGNIALRASHPNWIGNFHNKQTFLCSSYYPYWGKYITQKRYTMMTLSEIIRNVDWLYETFGVNDQIFIRPDSGEKEFNGEIVSRGCFRQWTESVNNASLPPTLLCVVSRPENLLKEFRLIIANGKVVTGSLYRVSKHIFAESLESLELLDVKQNVIDFAHKVLNDNPPPLPPVFVLDIAQEENGFSVLEIGCMCCAGFYECDRKAIAEKVSEAVEGFAFEKHLERASAIVSQWPAWKQNLLGKLAE